MESFSLNHIPDDFVRGLDVASGDIAYHVPTGEDRIRFDELTKNGLGEVVCLLDTGTTPGHPDLRDPHFMWSEVPGESSGIDNNFHGTHTMGSACGSPEISLAHQAGSGSIQVLSARGSGQSNWMARALKRAREWRGPKGERVTAVSISIGGGGQDREVERELELCDAAGIIVIAAAGNDGWRQGQDTINNPGRSVHTIAEGAIDRNESRAGFGSGGPLIDAVSPGVDVVSANYRGGRAKSNGTSMATPVEASKALCVQSFLTHNGFARLRGTTDYRKFLKKYARDILAPGHDDGSGNGILDVFETLIKERPDDVIGLSKIAQFAMFFIGLSCLLCGRLVAQDVPVFARSLEVEEVEVSIVSQTIDRQTVSIGDELLGASDTITDGKTSERTALSLDYGPQPVRVTAFTAATFSPVTPYQKKSDPTVYVLAADPGIYLVVAELDDGSTNVRPVIVPGVKPDEPPPIDPIPDVDLSGITALSKKLADAMSDQPTRDALATAYSAAIELAKDKPLAEAQSIVKNYIVENVFPQRKGESQYKDWVNGFQRPLQKQLDSVGIEDTANYISAIEKVIAGLKSSPAVSAKVVSPPIQYSTRQPSYPLFKSPVLRQIPATYINANGCTVDARTGRIISCPNR